MRTRRNRSFKRRHIKSRRHYRGGKKNVSGKKWTTAISAAQQTLEKTGSLEKARTSLKRQALTNARKLFGSVSSL